MKPRSFLLTSGRVFPAVLCAVLLAPMLSAAAAAKPDRIKARHQQVEATLVPASPIPKTWLVQRVMPAQVIQETEDAWAALLAQDPPVENTPGKKNGAERKKEREDLVERRDVFLACFARDKAYELYRYDGGPGKAFGYVIMKDFQALYHYELGVRAP